MRKKIGEIFLNFLGGVMILTGYVGMWTRYPAVAIALLLTGVSILPSLYSRLSLKPKVWRFVLPSLAVLFITTSLLLIPQKQPPIAEYIGENDPPVFVYINKSGERYHYNQGCAGKAARRVKYEYINGQEITPCQRCCD